MPDLKPISVIVDIPQQKIARAIATVFFLNIFILLGTVLHHRLLPKGTPNAIKKLIAQLNLSTENVAATWYSSMLLLAVAIVAAGCFFADMQRKGKWKDRFLNWGWLVLVMIFLLLSFDEMGSFHEMIGETTLFKNIGNDPGAGWYAFFVLIALVAVLMLLFSLVKFKGSAWAFFFATLGILLLASNPFQENYEISSWHNSSNPATWKRPVLFLLLEEGSEIFASFCFLVSFCIYFNYSWRKNNSGYSIQMKIQRNIIFFPIIFSIVLGLLMLVIRLNAWNFKGDDIGIPHNWFPSAMLFLTATVSMLLHMVNSIKMRFPLYLIIAAHCMLASVFFGSNLSQISKYSFFYTGFLWAVSVGLGMLTFYKTGSIFNRLAFVAWSISLFMIVVITNSFLVALSGYISASILLPALLLHFRQLAEKTDQNQIS